MLALLLRMILNGTYVPSDSNLTLLNEALICWVETESRPVCLRTSLVAVGVGMLLKFNRTSSSFLEVLDSIPTTRV